MNNVISVTESICPVCKKTVPAEIFSNGTEVFLHKVCSVHGEFTGLVWSDLSLYERACGQQGSYALPEVLPQESMYQCGLYGEAVRKPCLVIIDITQQCNTGCPMCIADTPSHRGIPPLSVGQIKKNIESLQAEVKSRFSIQLSGGEPTVYEDLVPLLKMIRDKGFDSVDMNTNGLAFAEKPGLAQELKEAGLTGIFLQFDGLSPDVSTKIRGRELLKEKIKAIEHCQHADLPVVLQPTIMTNINDHEVWDIVRFAVNAGTAGVDFLPYTPIGKLPGWGEDPLSRVTTSDIMKALEKQSDGEICVDDLFSVPCADARCAVVAYTLIRGNKLVPATREIDFSALHNKYGNLAEWDTIFTDLKQKNDGGSCCSSSSCCAPNRRELSADGYFVIGCHGFQDPWNFDVERAKRCGVHELTPTGKLIPFCYYSITRNQWNHPHGNGR